MSGILRRPSSAVALLALLTLLAVGVVAGLKPLSGAAAVPSGESVGKVTLTGLPGSPAVTTTIRSFSMSGTNPTKYAPGVPTVNLDTLPNAPLLLRALATGIHLPDVKVVLYRPGTTTRMEQWTFAEAQLTTLQTIQSGPPGRAPRIQLGWSFRRITQATYATDGTTVSSSYCYDLALQASC